MKEIIVEPTKTTFSVLFDFSKGLLHFSGNSYPENAIEFFQPLINKLKNVLKNYHKPLEVVFVVNYFNTSSSKYMFKIMELLDQYKRKGNVVQVYWHLQPGEEDMLETWHELMDELDMDFTVVEA
ncbi:MAG: DUF1987 domain-containing protein [Bacteroidales bacterium]